MARKTNKTQLLSVYDSHSNSMNNYHAAVGKDEKVQAINRLKRTGSALIEALKAGVTKSVGDYEQMAERLIDRSAQIIDGNS